MDIKNMPILLLLLTIFVLVVGAIEFGYLAGRAIKKRREVESESTVSSISSYVLALLAFMVAFTFSIVTDRYQTRKELVREEANLIRTTWMRADFLPDSDRVIAVNLLKEYTGSRLMAVKSSDPKLIQNAVEEGALIRKTLWDMAVVNARKDMDSDVAALYIESLNDVANINASRVVVGLHTRIPEGVWHLLLILTLLAMISVGYQTAIVGSRRSWATGIMALSFSLVIVMIEALDRSHTNLIPVSQFPMEYLLEAMNKVDQIH
jgi:CDP-diglyceride synthetase